MTIISMLNKGSVNQRLDALKTLVYELSIHPKKKEMDVNNHVHTFYSFSPYSPTHAAYACYQAGLSVAGIIDHDTVSGIKEFREAAKILKMVATAGTEVRVKFPVFDRIINNPDQKGVMYMVAHGICDNHLDDFNTYLKPYRTYREIRNRKMVIKINQLLKAVMTINYDQDVRTLSLADEGGSVTERHILFALAKTLLKHFDDMDQLIAFVQETFDVNVSEKQRRLLHDKTSTFIAYDLLGVLKTNTSKYYIPASQELPDAKEFVAFAISHGAIPAYAYLGDVNESVTGDKRAQTFEDNYLEDLFIELKKIGVPAIAYMPTRNTLTQIERLQQLAKQYDMIEISGEDINSPRQQFNCDAYQDPKYAHLIQSAWALVGHEALYSHDPNRGLLGSYFKNLSIKNRIAYFSDFAKSLEVFK